MTVTYHAVLRCDARTSPDCALELDLAAAVPVVFDARLLALERAGWRRGWRTDRQHEGSMGPYDECPACAAQDREANAEGAAQLALEMG